MHNSNYMIAAELKIAKLDPINDLYEIMYLRCGAKIQEIILEQILNEQMDFELLNRIGIFTQIKEEENELRNM